MKTAFDDVAPWPTEDKANPRAVMGDNRPPLDEEAKATFREELLKDRPDFEGRLDDMEGAANRVRVTDDDSLGRAGDFLKMLRAADKHVAAAHVAAKKPYLDAGRAVDTAKNELTSRISDMRRKVEPKVNGYIAEREAEQKRLRDLAAAEARRQAEAAAKAEAERQAAAEAGDVAAMEAAPIVAEAAAPVKAAEPVRSDAGTTISVRKEWRSEVTDYETAFIAADLAEDEKVREAIDKAVARRVKAGARKIDGVRIWPESKGVAV